MFDLALKLGRTVGELEQMSARELQEWKIYSRIIREEVAEAHSENKATMNMNKHKRK